MMARLAHGFGWLIATGMPGWVLATKAAAVWVEWHGYDERSFAMVTGSVLAASLLLGLMLARSTWRRPRSHRPLLWTGGVVAVLGIGLCALLLALSVGGVGSTPGRHGGELTLVLAGMLALVFAAAGTGLVIAGIAGVVARRR
ncbi:MAG: hypothetical protein KDC98_10410 [Planctomycetes bacterium]|nr:hypothetical protein [Planctomycetota bacterium]